MKIQVLSDLHLEHGGFVPEHHPAADVTVLAGDLAPCTDGLVERLGEHWASAPHILYVLGNRRTAPGTGAGVPHDATPGR